MLIVELVTMAFICHRLLSSPVDSEHVY